MVSGCRIVYFGTPDFAVPALRTLLKSRHEVVAVVSQPDRPKGRGHKVAATPTKTLAALFGARVLQPVRLKDETFLADIRALHADLGVVAAYGRILPDALLEIPRLGTLNIHASLLPKYRGAAPVHRAVIAGDTQTGVTIMRVVRELDAGPMLATSRRPIGADETSVEVERDLAEMGASLLLATIEDLVAGRAAEVPQDDSQATLAPKIEKSEGVVDWSQPARRIHNLVRGLQPWPLASVSIEGARCLVHRTVLTEERTSATSGTILRASGDDLAIAAGDGRVLRVVSIQPEGRRAMTARAFLAGRRVTPGTRVDSR
ncbi:MAG: methionyl-tRNA formyltransferase [Acidobacteria bacterium RIFCSPLOWO2_02_FULL_67_36]|nr:MAG: methionyl-tRNA formyltransferase [Acidobacteria bacterium RIFCSPLOWO2_02_FULL_67_36]OFW25109.1 MAG: methionyl-tRNA formyltransferase [Acidobacteria bacterium RIFCSPLOWO2_12_FULL_66_21]